MQYKLKSTGQIVTDVSIPPHKDKGMRNHYQTPAGYYDVLIPHESKDFHHALPGSTFGRLQRVRRDSVAPLKSA